VVTILELAGAIMGESVRSRASPFMDTRICSIRCGAVMGMGYGFGGRDSAFDLLDKAGGAKVLRKRIGVGQMSGDGFKDFGKEHRSDDELQETFFLITRYENR